MTRLCAAGSGLGGELAAVPAQRWLKVLPQLLAHLLTHLAAKGHSVGPVPDQIAQPHISRAPAMGLHLRTDSFQ